VVAGDSFYGAYSVFFDEKFAYFDGFLFGEVFAVEWGGFGFCEDVVAVEAFVELVVCTVFSIFDEVFFFFFLVVSALDVLAGYWNDASWARHNIVQI
jgi:hypothetical protein